MARLFPMVSAETKVRNFTANATWTAPLTTTSLTSANGKGAAGSPEYDNTQTRYFIDEYYYWAYYDSKGNPTSISQSYFNSTQEVSESTVPRGAFCYPYQSYSGPEGAYRALCYHYVKRSPTTGGYTPPTTGASATFAAGVAGTSRTFPGGYAGPAPTTSFDNVPVVPGQTYNIAVPPGGSITITYQE